MTKLAILGCGHMGKAILSGLLEAQNSPISNFMISMTSNASAEKLKTEFKEYKDSIEVLVNDNVKAAREADVVMLAFPPGQLTNALSGKGMKDAVKAKLVVSILAGTSIEDITRAVAGSGQTDMHVVRVLPSLGARAKESASLMVDEEPRLPEDMQNLVEKFFECVGGIHPCPPELFDELTAVNGVCHALMSVAVDALIDGCVAKGIPRDHARVFAGMSWIGYARLLAEGKEPAELKNSLLIPNGLTVQAMLELERRGARVAVSEALSKTVDYTKAMNK